MNKKFFSGDSVQQALLQAGRFFEVEPDKVAYREVDRRHGFLRGRRRAVIEVDLDNPVRSDSADPAPGGEAEPVAPRVESAAAAVAVDEVAEAGRAEDAERIDPPAEPAVEVVADAPPATQEPPTEEMPRERLDDWSAAEPAEAAKKEERLAARDEPAAEDAGPSPAPAPAAAEPVAESRPAAAVDETAVRQALARIFELGRLELEIERVRQGEEKLEIELRGEDEEFLLEDRGRLLLAIQHLLPRLLRGITGKSMPCQVDCDDFHEIRTEQLRDLAQRVASEVRNRRRSRTLEPMSPDERRIVHLTLADDPAVETVSQGNGLFKRVQIRPQKMQPRGFDPFARE